MREFSILYVITKLELGGAQRQLLSLIRDIIKENRNIFLFTARDGFLVSEAVSIDGLRIKKSKFLERPINIFKDILSISEIYFFIKRNKIEIVHTNSSKAGIIGRIAAKLAGVKIIIHTVHGWSFNDCQFFLKRWLFIQLERLTAGFTTKIIVVSEHDKQRGLINRIGTEDRYELIRYGINYNDFIVKSDKSIKKELSIPEEHLVVGMVACFKPQKSPQDFVKLACITGKILPNIKFVLIGDGILRPYLNSLIKNLNLEENIVLTGWRTDIPRMLSVIDVFVLTSLWEGLPITALEAMASGNPVLATDTGGIKEVIEEGVNGYLVPPKSIERMSVKLSDLLKDNNLRKRIGENARNNLNSDFTIDNMVGKNKRLYEYLLGGENDN